MYVVVSPCFPRIAIGCRGLVGVSVVKYVLRCASPNVQHGEPGTVLFRSFAPLPIRHDCAARGITFDIINKTRKFHKRDKMACAE